MKRSAVLFALALAAAPAFAQYKYTTPDGRTVYSDQPPPTNARNVQQRDFAGGEGGVDTSRMPYELRRATENFPVTLYTVPDCAPCDAGRALLNKRGVPFREKTVTTPADAEYVRSNNLGNSFPVLLVGSGKTPNFNEGAWQSALDYAGYPKNPPPPGSFRNPAPSAAAPAKAATPAPAAQAPADATPSAPPAVNPDNPAGIRF